MKSDENIMKNKCNIEADIAIIGGGGAGLTAAIVAAESGVNNVILLEVRNSLGGNVKGARMFFAVESPVQKRMGINTSKDEFFKEHMEYTHWRTDPMVVRAFINQSGDSVRWLEEKGVQFDHVVHLLRNRIPVCHVNTKPRTGDVMVSALVKSCENLGVKILCGTRGKKLLTDRKGRVTGVLAESKEGETTIMAKSVIIATGGFLGNRELLKKYCPQWSDDITISGLPHKGDGLLMAQEIGAATEGLGVLNIYGPDFHPFYLDLYRIVAQPNMLWVNKRGERFVDESTHTRSFADSANAIARQPGAMSYTLFDQRIKDINTREGLPGGNAPGVFSGQRNHWEGEDLVKLDEQFKQKVNEGKVKISGSWDDIAKWMGISSRVLRSTVNEYNSFCSKGYDEIFAKDNRYLMALSTPPYYAMECHMHCFTTVGGIKINHKMEVINNQWNPISGLYAVGVDAGGWEEDSYNYLLAGSALSFAITSGLIAGKNAAQYVSRIIRIN